MNSRVAKKIGCYPYDIYTARNASSPYTAKQIRRASRKQDQSFKRSLAKVGGDHGRAKPRWGRCKNTKVWKSKWRPGCCAEKQYGRDAERRFPVEYAAAKKRFDEYVASHVSKD